MRIFNKNKKENTSSPKELKKNPQDKPKKPRGRPKSELQDKEVVSLFLTKEQKEELRQRAKKADLPMTKYIMIKVFGLDI